MKITFHHGRIFSAVMFSMIVFQPLGSAADDLNTLFQLGKAAYYRGDFEQAQLLLNQVAAKQPNHFETKALLAQIRTQMKPEGSLRKSYQSVTLQKIEFTDVSLEEAVEGLRALSKAATEGKVVPNIIIKDSSLSAKKLSLNLRNLPLTDAIQYLADLSGAKTVYDKHAVIFTTASTASN